MFASEFDLGIVGFAQLCAILHCFDLWLLFCIELICIVHVRNY